MIIESRIHFREYLNLMYRLTYRKPIMIGLVTFNLLMIVWIVCYYTGLITLLRPEYPQFLAAVSYTHLDVYKRQTKACGMMLETAKDNINGNALYISAGFTLEKNLNHYTWDV